MTEGTSTVSVTELYLYPLKSARGIPVPVLQFDERGPIGDRRWMLIDPDAQFLSQRRIPRMALLHVALQEDALHVDAPGMPTLMVPRPAGGRDGEDTGERLIAGVWDDAVTVCRASADADRWFTAFLDQPCSLVTMPDDAIRLVDPTYAPTPRSVTLADAFPLLLLGAGSLDELNGRLAAKGVPAVGIDRFRPNIVVSGAAPHAEDGWHRLVGSGIALDIVKPCARCAIVTVDQERGVRVVEPLKTLETYRRRGSKVYFGQNALHDRPGRIVRGEDLDIVS